MSLSEASTGSGMSVGSSVSRWGDGDPGVGMTGVQVRVLGGAVGMAASVQ